MRKKCFVCNSCLDDVWVLPHHFLHCWLCDIYYVTSAGDVRQITKEEFESIIKKGR
jgi:hypothetical protein